MSNENRSYSGSIAFFDEAPGRLGFVSYLEPGDSLGLLQVSNVVIHLWENGDLVDSQGPIATIHMLGDAVETARSLVGNAKDPNNCCPQCWNMDWRPIIGQPLFVPIPDASMRVTPLASIYNAMLYIDPKNAIACISIFKEGQGPRIILGLTLTGSPPSGPISSSDSSPCGHVFLHQPPITTEEDVRQYQSSEAHS
jgi:hypothetical protein